MTSGGCLCGAVRFTYSGDPKWVLHCHCESCRKATSSPMTTWLSVPDENLTFDRDARKSFESSPGATRTFCDKCGSPMTFTHTRFPGETHLYVASLDVPDAVRPSRHVFFEERVQWCDLHDDLPRFNQGSGKGRAPDSRGPAC